MGFWKLYSSLTSYINMIIFILVLHIQPGHTVHHSMLSDQLDTKQKRKEVPDHWKTKGALKCSQKL